MTQKQNVRDWHSWDIRAALGKKGYTLAKVARVSGYARSAPTEALRKPWPAVERIIADIIGIEPWVIWPTRYDDQHRPLRGLGSTIHE